jgi:hypothetical protein
MTKRYLVWIGLGILLTGVAQAAEEWKTYTSEEGRMSFLMPSMPKGDSHTTQAAEAPFTLYRFTAASKDRSATYYAMYADVTPVSDPRISKEMLLDAGRDGEARKFGVPVRNEKSITLQGRPGRAFTLDRPGGWVTQYRFYLDGNRLYELIASTRAAQENAPEVKTFLGSLKLLR